MAAEYGWGPCCGSGLAGHRSDGAAAPSGGSVHAEEQRHESLPMQRGTVRQRIGDRCVGRQRAAESRNALKSRPLPLGKGGQATTAAALPSALRRVPDTRLSSARAQPVADAVCREEEGVRGVLQYYGAALQLLLLVACKLVGATATGAEVARYQLLQDTPSGGYTAHHLDARLLPAGRGKQAHWQLASGTGKGCLAATGNKGGKASRTTTSSNRARRSCWRAAKEAARPCSSCYCSDKEAAPRGQYQRQTAAAGAHPQRRPRHQAVQQDEAAAPGLEH